MTKRIKTRPNVPRTRSPLAYLALLCVPAAALPLAVFGGCGEDSNEFRRGQQGDSCLTTNDCDAPLSCIEQICGGPTPTPDAGDTMDAMVVGDGPSAEAGPWSMCDNCLDMKCAAELAACGQDCISIEACLEEVCENLSSVNAVEDGKCQTSCQSQYPGAKDAHLAVVDCAIKATCRPPCTMYPEDYDACVAFMNKGDCAGALAACNASPDCIAYRGCVSTCTTLSGCIACSGTPEGAAGKKLLQEYERCVATECISEAWLLTE